MFATKKRMKNEEKGYLNNRPDILLFPEEKKVMIIDPNIERTDHLEEIITTHILYIIYQKLILNIIIWLLSRGSSSKRWNSSSR